MSRNALENTRDVSGDRRHLRVIGQDKTLCATVAAQSACGAGRFSALLAWTTCAKCRTLAAAIRPADSQRDDVPLTMELAL